MNRSSDIMPQGITGGYMPVVTLATDDIYNAFLGILKTEDFSTGIPIPAIRLHAPLLLHVLICLTMKRCWRDFRAR
jgi:hypothetical protein